MQEVKDFLVWLEEEMQKLNYLEVEVEVEMLILLLLVENGFHPCLAIIKMMPIMDMLELWENLLMV